MTNPTSNFGWQMPTSTDLVTDLPADFEVFGQAVDTDFVDLLGGTTGQVLSKTSATDLDFTWVTANPGDITGVTAGTGISGGGTSGTVTVTNDMATTITAAGDIVVGTGSGTYDNLPIGTTAQVLTADTTVSPYKVKWATPSAGAAVSHVRAISSTTSVTTATWTKVIFVTESYDTLSEFASSRFTAASTGYYNVSAGVCSASGALNLGSQMIVAIYKNGTAFVLGSSYAYPGSVTARGSARISSGLSLAATDYIEIYVLQSLTGGTVALDNADGPQNFVSIDRLQD